MPIDDMSADFLAQGQGGFQPQTQNNILLRIHGLNSASAGAMGEDILTVSLESFPIPKTTLEAMELDFMNEKVKFAGKATVEDMSVVYKDFVDMGTLETLSDWFYGETYNPLTGKIGLTKNYKKEATVTMYAPDGTHDREFYCKGLWINNFDAGDADQTAGDKKPINITYSIDKVYPLNFSSKGTIGM